jgi:hypothetical protein
MKIESELKLGFDDVPIRPKRSVAPSRASVNLKREHRFRITPSEVGWTGIPIIAANLDTIGTMRMATALHDLNMLTCPACKSKQRFTVWQSIKGGGEDHASAQDRLGRSDRR